ncbi:class I SAM-dependent methyltransferase [Cohnella faecalis]|uniref:SAM-dependent methyltransferase n=1 Tax=Cohnella faecalis TaxID=2315694 RepID=A0A398CJW1_9BACL|nr:SAM-dependent methyltransferase [Cohnella faecalis]RIE02635.1 SAM-dependent methyltransferase [Cohnella faecalis]
MTIKEKGLEGWLAFVGKTVAEGQLLQATFSQPRRKDGDIAAKLTVRPIAMKNGTFYQFESLQGNKAYHDNVPAEQAEAQLIETMAAYKQALFKTPEADVQVLANKKGELTLLRGAATSKIKAASSAAQSHNRSKAYVIPEGEPVPFLVRLGVMTEDGRVVKAKYDKFRQINRFLEMVSDVLPDLPRGKELTVVDFGCGKSYLTFALYHLLAVRERLPVRIIGLDLKKDVIETCSKLAVDLGWDKLAFFVGDISDYRGEASVDMVVTLHACDTATDAALLQAISWDASVILSVPCCQHELFKQIKQPALSPLLKHGILKERFAALVTDAVRANLLEQAGYRTQIMEFIDLEHTPKNLLIRAVRGSGDRSEETAAEYAVFRDLLSISPFMEKRLAEIRPKSE